MKRSFILSVFGKLILKIQQSFCDHAYAFKKSELIVGRRCALHVCIKCRKLRLETYASDYDKDRLFTDMIFSGKGAGRSSKNY